MRRFTKTKALIRAIAVVSAVMVIVSGVTFAALQSQQDVIKGNTIQTASANLQLSSDGTTYTSSLNGFTFNNLIPGGQPSPTVGYPVNLKNAGSTPLSVKLSIAKAITNPDNVDLTKVHVVMSPFSGGVPQNVTLQDLITGATNGGVQLNIGTRLTPAQTTGFFMQISMEADAFSGSSTTLSDIDFSFSASAVN